MLVVVPLLLPGPNNCFPADPAARRAAAAVPKLFIRAVGAVTKVVVQVTGRNYTVAGRRTKETWRDRGISRTSEGPILTRIDVRSVAVPVCGTPTRASLAIKIVFVSTGRAITIPIVQTENADSARAFRTRKVDIKTVAVPNSANIWTRTSLAIPIVLIS